jgi:hypothetical protein
MIIRIVIQSAKNVILFYDANQRVERIDYLGTDNDIEYTYYETKCNIDRYNGGNIESISKGKYFNVDYMKISKICGIPAFLLSL